MKLLKTTLLLASAASVLSLAACNAAKDEKAAAPAASAAKASEPPVATVNGTPISKSRIDMLIKQGGAQGQPDSPDTRQAILDQLTMQMVIAEEAVKKGLDKTPDVTEKLEVIKQSILANAYVQDYIKNNPVTEEAMKAEYERIKATITGTEYKARHILVEKESEAKDIIAKLKKDAGAFAKLAELGWFDVSRMVPEFGAAVTKLEKGAITQEPVKTQFGYHVIQLEDSKPVEAPPFDDVKGTLSQQLAQQNLKKQLDDLKAKAKIEIAGAPAAAASAPATAAPAPAATPAAVAPAPAASAAPAAASAAK